MMGQTLYAASELQEVQVPPLRLVMLWEDIMR